MSWTVQCNEWVHFNVVPHLWRDHYVDTEASIGARLKVWIENLKDEVVIVSDWPQGDFFIHLKHLLPDWPSNLNRWPVQFNSWSMGDDCQALLSNLIEEYHNSDRPRHHALHDAHSLRVCFQYAIKHGWTPDLR